MASTYICHKCSTTFKKLTVSTAKSIVTLFTPDTHEHHLHPQVKLADHVLPLKKKPKVLGVTLDTHLTFTQHCNNITVKVQQCNNVLKALAGSTWGCDKETLLMTYMAIVRSIFSYCCPVWTPSPKDTNWRQHQQACQPSLRYGRRTTPLFNDRSCPPRPASPATSP